MSAFLSLADPAFNAYQQAIYDANPGNFAPGGVTMEQRFPGAPSDSYYVQDYVAPPPSPAQQALLNQQAAFGAGNPQGFQYLDGNTGNGQATNYTGALNYLAQNRAPGQAAPSTGSFLGGSMSPGAMGQQTAVKPTGQAMPSAPSAGVQPGTQTGMQPGGSNTFTRFITQPQSLSGNFQTSTQLADPTIRAAYIDNLNFANAVAERPYEQYGGPRIADFSADQQAAFANTRTAAAGPQNFLQGNIAAYQNPYTQQVIDTTMGDIDRARQLQQQQVNAQALSRGAFGGSRQAVAESENSRNYLDQQARTSAQLRNQGFENAANLMNTDINRSIGANQNLLQAGNQQQAQVQANYNTAQQDFQNQFNYPLQQLQIRSAALGVQPYGGDRATQTPLNQNNLATTLGALGAGTSILNNLGLSRPVGNFLGGLGSSVLSGLGGLFGSSSGPTSADVIAANNQAPFSFGG